MPCGSEEKRRQEPIVFLRVGNDSEDTGEGHQSDVRGKRLLVVKR